MANSSAFPKLKFCSAFHETLPVNDILYLLQDEVRVAPQRVPNLIVRARVAFNVGFYRRLAKQIARLH